MRPWFNAGFCLLLLALGWATQVSAGYPFDKLEPLGPWAWSPAILGTFACVLGVPLCFLAARRRHPVASVTLLLAGAALVVAALGGYLQAQHTLELYGNHEVQRRVIEGRAAWLAWQGAHVQFVLALGLLWSGIAFAVSVAVAACVPRGTRPARPDTFRWAWPLAGVAALGLFGALYLAAYGRVFRYLFDGQFGRIERVPQLLVDHLAHVGGVPVLLPQLVGLLWLCMLAFLALGLRPVRSDLEERSQDAVTCARATAATASVAAAVCLAFGSWVWTSAQVAFWMAWAPVTPMNTMGAWGKAVYNGQALEPFRAFHAANVPSIGLILLTLLLVTPLLVLVVRRPRQWAPPALACLALLGFAGAARMTVAATIDDLFRPDCPSECLKTDVVATMLLLHKLPSNRAMIHDDCPFMVIDPQPAGVTLPRVETTTCPEPFTTDIYLGPDEVRRLGRPVKPPAGPPSQHPVCETDWASSLLRELTESVDDARALESRNPSHPFNGILQLVADQHTTAADVDCVRSLAMEAGYTDLHATALLPGLRGDVPMIRAIPLGPLTSSTQLARAWSARLDPGEITLTSPTGETWTGPDAATVIDQARPVIARDPNRGVVRIERHPSLPLQADLDARLALTGPDLFSDAWSPPVWPPPPQPAP